MKKVFSGIFLLFAFTLNGFSQELNLPETVPVCNKTSIEIDAGEGFDSYTWNTGDTTQSISVSEEGLYFVTVLSGGGLQTDSTYVEFFDYLMIPDQDTTLCYGEEFLMYVVPETYAVEWQPDGVENDSLYIYPQEEKSYDVYITGDTATCVESFDVSVHSKMSVELQQVNEICYGTCDGQVIASVSGGTPPYEYLWNNFSVPWDSIATALCAGENSLKIIDANGCTFDTTFTVDALPAADVEILTRPTDTIFIDNPTITFSFQNNSSEQINEWLWEFGDGDTSLMREVEHTFEGVKGTEDAPPPDNYVVTLDVVNEYGCDTIITKEMPIEEAELRIPNVITPNGDGFNDKFIIQNEKTGNDISYEYKRVELIVYNRYGKVVYQDDNYNSDWTADGLSDGTYFYVIRTYGYFRNDDYQGALTIIGSGN